MKIFKLVGDMGFMEKDSRNGEPYSESLRKVEINETIRELGVIEAKKKAKEILLELVDKQERKPDSVVVELLQVVSTLIFEHPKPAIKAQKAKTGGFVELPLIK